jgi:hypothetical protein
MVSGGSQRRRPDAVNQSLVRGLRTAARGQVGLYVDNGSDDVFANVHIVHGS